MGLCKAAQCGDLNGIQNSIQSGGESIDSTDEDGRTSLHWSCARGYDEIANYLLEKRAAVDPTDDAGWTPLMCAVSGGHLEIVESLIKTGKVDVNRMNDGGYTALHYACSKGHDLIVEFLLDRTNANVNVRDRFGNTPLHRASGFSSNEIKKKKRSGRIVQLLIDHGANVNAKNALGETPLHVSAIENNELVSLTLIQSGADVLIENEESKNCLEVCGDRELRAKLLELAQALNPK